MGISFVFPARTAVAIYCERFRAINTAISFLYTVSIGRKKKKSNDMKRVVDNKGTVIFLKHV